MGSYQPNLLTSWEGRELKIELSHGFSFSNSIGKRDQGSVVFLNGECISVPQEFHIWFHGDCVWDFHT